MIVMKKLIMLIKIVGNYMLQNLFIKWVGLECHDDALSIFHFVCYYILQQCILVCHTSIILLTFSQNAFFTLRAFKWYKRAHPEHTPISSHILILIL
jgi:hypothetical protein